MNRQDLLNQRELMQDDLLCLLDGLDDSILTHVCNIVVDRFAILLNKFDYPGDETEPETWPMVQRPVTLGGTHDY